MGSTHPFRRVFFRKEAIDCGGYSVFLCLVLICQKVIFAVMQSFEVSYSRQSFWEGLWVWCGLICILPPNIKDLRAHICTQIELHDVIAKLPSEKRCEGNLAVKPRDT